MATMSNSAQTSAPATDRRTLLSLSRSVSDTSLLDFLRHCEGLPRVYFDNDELPSALAGGGVVACVSASGPGRFQSVQAQIARFARGASALACDAPHEARARWFGGFSFRSGHRTNGVWSHFPEAYFVLPRYQLTRWEGGAWLTVNGRQADDESPPQAAQRLERLHRAFGAKLVSPHAPTPARQELPDYARDVVGQSDWQALVERITTRIRTSALEKVVLAQARQLRFATAPDVLGVLDALRRPYANCYRFLVEPQPGHAFFGAAPELLLSMNEDALETMAMASSTRRGATSGEDRLLGERLMSSPKERHEHDVVVQSIKRRLGPLVQQLHCADEPHIVRFSNIQHLRTKVRARLKPQRGLFEVLQALHPTPAMGGTPRQVALDVIERYEPFQRGWYASPVGWIDQEGNGTFAVAIRSAVSAGREVQLFAGAGIVTDSNPEKEWAEVQLKFRPIVEALGLA